MAFLTGFWAFISLNWDKLALALSIAYGAIMNVVSKYKEVISYIALRIEKDLEDGQWTDEEKEQLAIDVYFEKVLPKLPWYLKLIPKTWIEGWIRGLIKKLCKKAKGVQPDIEAVK